MAATQFATMPSVHHLPAPALKTENFDMENFFDFSQAGPSPTTAASSSKLDATPTQDWSPFEPSEEHSQQFNGPSHDYTQYKQQVGLPVGSMTGIPSSAGGMYDGYSSGIGEMGFDGNFQGYGSGLDVDGDMGMDFNQQPAMFYPTQRQPNQNGDNFVNPSTIGGHEEPPSNVGRLWPGMHSQQAQQAAMQKAVQQQMMQQRQMRMHSHQQQQHHRQSIASQPSQSQQQQPQQGNGKRPSHANDPVVEERISRLLNEMRQASHTGNGDDADSPGSVLPHIARMRKDEEEMDDDERLLASDEGKKLSSKERRQLRNKVSARAFRSRRKEYIGQLEGEVAVKTQEAQQLRVENTNLLNENNSYRALITTLLGHAAFRPFLEDISKDPAAFTALNIAMPPPPNGMQMQQQQQASQSVTPTPISQQSEQNFESNQMQQVPSQHEQQHHQPQQHQQQQQRVGMATIPENDFSKLNINGFGQTMNFNQFQSVNAYPVTSLDMPNYNPVDLLADSPATPAYSVAPANMDTNVLLARLERAAGRMK